jgi:hypothetical protein
MTFVAPVFRTMIVFGCLTPVLQKMEQFHVSLVMGGCLLLRKAVQVLHGEVLSSVPLVVNIGSAGALEA